MMWAVGYLCFRGGQGNVCHQQRLTHLCGSDPSGRLTMLPAFTPSLVGTAKCKQFKSCTDRLGPAVKFCICICRQEEGQVRNQMGQNSLRFLLLHNLPQMDTCCSPCACAHMGTHTLTHLPLAVPSAQAGCSPWLCHMLLYPCATCHGSRVVPVHSLLWPSLQPVCSHSATQPILFYPHNLLCFSGGVPHPWTGWWCWCQAQHRSFRGS